MRISGFALMLLLMTINLLVASPGNGQRYSDKKIDIDFKNAPLKEILTAIELKAGVEIMYEMTQAPLSEPVSITMIDKNLSEVLDSLLLRRKIKWNIRENIVRIEDASETTAQGADLKPTPNISPSITAPPITVRGRIVNENNEPVTANIMVKGINRGVSSDENGNFELTNITDNAVLVISATNIETIEFAVKGKTNVVISVKIMSASLNEVVINKGYYTEKQRLTTGSVVKVDAKEIEKQPVTSPLLALQGRAAGLEITPKTGAPGAAPAIRIRGENSLRSNGGFPLYIIDGVMIESRPLQSQQSGLYFGGVDPLSGLNVNNIESIEVLKDADATAIYGSKGANGVILIKTKFRKGNSESIDFNLNISRAVGDIPNRVDLLNTKQFLEMRNEAFTNAGITPSEYDYELTKWDTTRETDWQDVLLGGKSKITDVSADLSGGKGSLTFRVNGSYHKETIFASDEFGFTRVNGGFNLNYNSLDQKLSINLSSNYGVAKNKSANVNELLSNALNLAPNAPRLYNEDGSLNWEIIDYGFFKLASLSNPMVALRKSTDSKVGNLVTSGKFGYKIINNLLLGLSLNYTETNTNETVKNPISAIDPTSIGPWSKGSAFFTTNLRSSWNIEPQLSYSKKINYHSFDALIGLTLMESTDRARSIYATGYTSDALLGTLKGASDHNISTDDINQYRYNAVFARLGYNWKEKYLVNLTGRRDGSSRFGPGHQFGNFGAIGIGWIITNEKFTEKISNVLSFAKLQASYGNTGNDQIPDYGFYNLYRIGGFNYQNLTTLRPYGLFNENFRWEVTKKANITLDLGFLQDRLTLQSTFYLNRSSNQLVSYPLPSATGFSSVSANLEATIENKGWEFGFMSQNIKFRNFSWISSFNLSLPENKLVSYPGIEESPYAIIYKIGEPLSIRYDHVWKGIDPATGLHVLEDINNDGVLTDEDKRFGRNTEVKFYGGLNNTIRFKSFALSFLFRFKKGVTGNPLSVAGYPGVVGANQPVTVLNRWKKPGDITDVGKFIVDYSLAGSYFRVVNSNYGIVDASFLRLQTLSASYDLPQSLLNKVKLKSAQLFLYGFNLFTITDYTGLDPEMGPSSLPQMRVFTLGLQLKL